MKKRIIILSSLIIVLSVLTFGFVKESDSEITQTETATAEILSADKEVKKEVNPYIMPDIFYGIGTRFGAIKKEDINKAKSINDFLSEKQLKRIVSFKSVTVTILEDATQTKFKASGNSKTLNAAQLKLLQTADYSTNILIRADYTWHHPNTGILEDSYTTPHLTIVPEKQAEYEGGTKALVDYLKTNSEKRLPLFQKDLLKPAKLYFRVNKNGSISHLKLMRSSGFPAIDKLMLELIEQAPGTWAPAENASGETVDQDLVFSYGIMGC